MKDFVPKLKFFRNLKGQLFYGHLWVYFKMERINYEINKLAQREDKMRERRAERSK